jgi:hypothetical protein
MSEQAKVQLKNAMEDAPLRYFRLVLLAGSSGTGKSHLLQWVAQEQKCEVVNINLLLAGRLLELSALQRCTKVSGILAEVVESFASPVFLDNAEILFDQSLELDPLRLLQGLSRNRTLVVAWNGRVNQGRLSYAEPGHPEYRFYDQPDAILVSMGDE